MSAFALHLMRHGAPVHAGRLIGHDDAPSSEGGCVACVERARDLVVNTVISSDLQRARRPAAMIAAAQGLPLRIDPRWRELDFGSWEGADPATLDPQALAAFWQDPQAHPPPTGESWNALAGRVEAALAEIAAPTLVVSHGGAIRAALACLLGLDYRQSWGIALPYAALVSLRVWPEAPRSVQITGLIA